MTNSKIKYDVYLAGKMGGRIVADVIEERLTARYWCKQLGLSFYDPAADEGLDKLDPMSTISTRMSREVMAHYVEKDDSHLDQCRALLNLTGDMNSDGTGWEMGRAFYKLHIPIIIVAPERHKGLLVGFSSIKADSSAERQFLALRDIKTILKYERKR